MRIIIYTGKGGVGKTSVAAATAVRLAAGGQRVLVMSTDAAHSLSDSLGVPLGPDPVQVADNLFAQEVDSLREAERSWGSMQRWLAGVMQWAKIGDIDSEELLVFPGLEELFSLLQIRRQAESGRYDVLIVDCAPTGETLRLLSFPSTLYWWVERLLPTKRRLVKLARPVVKMVGKGLELPPEPVMDELEQLLAELTKMQSLLLNPDISSVRLVLNPEKMVIAEARRSFTYLNLFGFNTDAVIVNRLLPEVLGTDSYLSGWREAQLRYMQEIEASFSPLPILTVPHLPTEVTGLEMLSRVATEAFGGLDASAILHRGLIEEISKTEEGYALDLSIPFVPKEEVNLIARGEELTVQVGWYKRKVILPRKLLGCPVLGAKFNDNRLRVRFGERTDEQTKEAE